jgi:ATP-dependent DNA helicase RecG
LPDKFYLKGEQRISLRDLIFRELIANFLIHREYLNPRVSNLEINTEKCVIKNANKPHLYGSIEPTNYESFPKNPHIAKFFVQLARAEELGSGIRNVFRYSQLYSGKQPEFKEEDLFEVSIPLLVKKTTKETTKETTKRLKDREVLIISLITENNKINAVELAKKVDLSTDGIRYYLKKLKRKGILQRSGPTKGGAWVVLTKKFK